MEKRHNLDIKRHVLSILLLWLLCLFAPVAQAQNAAESACDPKYYASLKSRAWMEAQREITQNQNLIFKPDSVLEYTCFDQFLNQTATNSESAFSGPGMAAALESSIGTSMRAYINHNFDGTDTKYDLLGGRATGIDHDPQPIQNGTYNCDIMNKVWERAKCMNFIDNEQKDNFFGFSDYASGDDKRFLPTSCPMAADWTKNIQTAQAESEDSWRRDDIDTDLFADLDPANCVGSGNFMAPIKTGLIVGPITMTMPKTQSGRQSARHGSRSTTLTGYYYEKICPAAGCHYVPDGLGASLSSPGDFGQCKPIISE